MDLVQRWKLAGFNCKGVDKKSKVQFSSIYFTWILMLQSEVKYTHEWICLQIQKEKYITLVYTEEIKIMEGTLNLV